MTGIQRTLEIDRGAFQIPFLGVSVAYIVTRYDRRHYRVPLKIVHDLAFVGPLKKNDVVEFVTNLGQSHAFHILAIDGGQMEVTEYKTTIEAARAANPYQPKRSTGNFEYPKWRRGDFETKPLWDELRFDLPGSWRGARGDL